MCSRILEREKKIDDLRLETADAALRTMREVIAQGHDLISLHWKIKQGPFVDWLKSSFPKTPITAKRYMVVAAKSDTMNFLDNEQFQLELFRVSGLLPEPMRNETGENGVSIKPIIRHLDYITEWATRESQAIFQWETPRLVELEQRLTVAIQLRDRIHKILETRQ